MHKCYSKCSLPLPPSDPAAPASLTPPISKLVLAEQNTPAAKQVSEWKIEELSTELEFKLL